MPSSASDRFTVDFEYVFFFVKNKKYWFEQQFEPNLCNKKYPQGTFGKNSLSGKEGVKPPLNPLGKNKRCVWKITTKPFKGAHFATFPEDLIEPMIKAGCPKKGVVLDPFMGAGTTALVAINLGRNFLGFELNQEYIKIANKRIMPWMEQQKLGVK